MAIAKRGLAMFVAAALVSGPVLGAGDTALDGASIVATSYDRIPAGARFDLRSADDSELTYEAERLVRAGLQRRGFGFDPDSPLVLTVATEVTDGSADAPLPMQLGVSKGSLRMRLFLLGPNSSGLLQDSRDPTAGDYRIDLSVHAYVWRGAATTCRCGQSMLASTRQIVPALVEAIGSTVGPQSTASRY